MLQKTEPSNAEDSMEDIDHITRSVCDSAHSWILENIDQTGKQRGQCECYLAAQNEGCELVTIDPTQPDCS